MSTKTWVLIAAIIGSAMTFIDGSAVNVALPVVQRELHASSAQMQWVIEGYSLFLSALILLGGSLGDLYGRRFVFVAGVAIFAVSSLACGLAPNVTFLDLARAVQGVGAALAVPQSLALISVNFAGDERGKAIGTWSGAASITAMLGPVLGGWLAQTFSWRYVFLINLPLALAVIALSLVCVPESRDEELLQRLDVLGAVLATAGLGALTYGLIRAQGHGELAGIATIVLGCVLLGLFLAVEARSAAPMMPLSLFRSRAFSAANLYTFFLYATLGGALYFVPFLFINVQGYAPVVAGSVFVPFAILQFTLSRWSGGLIGRVGARLPLVVGALLAGAGFALFALPPMGSRPLVYLVAAVVLGLGGVCFVAPLTTTVFNAVQVEQSGIASGINNAVSRCSGLIAIAAFGIVLARFAPAGTADPDKHALLDGIRAVLGVSIVLCVVSAAVAALWIPNLVTQPRTAARRA